MTGTYAGNRKNPLLSLKHPCFETCQHSKIRLLQDKVNLTANVFDVDEVNKSTGAMDTELVDFFSQPLNITPDSNFLASKSHILLLMNKVR